MFPGISRGSVPIKGPLTNYLVGPRVISSESVKNSKGQPENPDWTLYFGQHFIMFDIKCGPYWKVLWPALSHIFKYRLNVQYYSKDKNCLSLFWSLGPWSARQNTPSKFQPWRWNIMDFLMNHVNLLSLKSHHRDIKHTFECESTFNSRKVLKVHIKFIP